MYYQVILSIEDMMYGIRASSKFIEKLIGIFEYVGDIIRQYKSFDYFEQLHYIQTENNIC